MKPGRRRRTAALLLVAGTVLATAACSGSSKKAGDGNVTITVNALPAKTDPVNRKNFLDDIAAFEKLHPKIKIKAHEGKMDPQTFATKPSGQPRTPLSNDSDPRPTVSNAPQGRCIPVRPRLTSPSSDRAGVPEEATARRIRQARETQAALALIAADRSRESIAALHRLHARHLRENGDLGAEQRQTLEPSAFSHRRYLPKITRRNDDHPNSGSAREQPAWNIHAVIAGQENGFVTQLPTRYIRRGCARS